MQQELPGLEPSNKKTDPSILDVIAGLDDPKSPFANCLVLTPNQSLAQQLRRRRLTELGIQSAEGGRIQVLSAWLSEAVRSNAKQSIATDTQLNLLWQIALEKTQHEFPELNPTILAPQALSAWRNLKRYEVSFDELRTSEVGQLVRFSDSIHEFEKLLKRQELSTLELEIDLLLKASNRETSKSTTTVFLYAFVEELPPLFSRWLDHNFQHVISGDYLASNPEVFLHPTLDAQSELTSAGRWAKQILEKDRNARIGIVHTGLADELHRSIRLTKSQLSQQTELSTSIQTPLSGTGVVGSALNLLRLNLHELDLAQARAIIHSPFWSDFAGEYNSRAKWDRALCNLRSRRISAQQLREALDNDDLESGSHLKKHLLDFSSLARQQTKKQSPLEWADIFHQQLIVLGWPCAKPGESDLSLVQAWYDVLKDFSELGCVSKKIDAGFALRLLQNCCDKRRTNPGASHPGVRLLDTVEGATDFTHLWMTGLSNTQWPSSPAPNPLLPVGLQRRHQMPRSSPEQETAVAQKLIDRVSVAANQVVFSYAQETEGIDQMPSGLLPDLLQLPESLLAINQSVAFPALNTELINTEFAPPISEAEKKVSRGSSLFGVMASSPFNAFAQWRLNAEPMAEPKTGLDAAERGTLVHWVLDAIWRQLENSEALHHLDASEICSLCDTTSRTELQRWQRKYGWLGKAYAELEIRRLSRLTQGWLNLEAERQSFRVVESEQVIEAEIGVLSFRLRLDRLDRLADDSLLLIDYKTGQSLSPKDWLELPPVEPQLPLYAISLEQTPNAICFAQVRPDQMRIIGIGQQALEKGFTQIENWDELITLWRSSLTELADDYTRGLTRVDETISGFGRADPFSPLHRINEYDSLKNWAELNK